jgi:DNA-directed RNA polymerase specialized sigma24 family protein
MSIEEQGSISRCLARVRDGEDEALRSLWDRYFEDLVRYARRALIARGTTRSDEDEEDVALSAFHVFCEGVREGRFPRLQDRHDLWRILTHLAACKVADRVRRVRAARRGGGLIRLETDLALQDDPGPHPSLDDLAGRDHQPELARLLVEECHERIAALPGPTLRLIATMKLAGRSNDEIRAALDCSLRTVTLKLELIRTLWEVEGPT